MHTYPYDHSAYLDDTAWEFKIVRARNREFGQRDHLEALLYQESLAGWIMTDKYNDSQIRFMRPRRFRERDHYLPRGIDPYRTTYIPDDDGSAQTQYAILLTLVVGATIMALVLVIILSKLTL